MSEEFDKEAEREKLREKFAKDDEKRKHTQRMSELLLKGATMTNRHCKQCGDPIFSHDGSEFCPTCPATAGSNGGATVGEGTDGAASAHDGDRFPTDRPEPGREADDLPRPSADGRTPTAARGVGPADAGPPRSDIGAGTVGGDAPGGNAAPGGVDDVAAARESLIRTVTRFAHAAERSEDPRRAREHLEAAREAAETLSALE